VERDIQSLGQRVRFSRGYPRRSAPDEFYKVVRQFPETDGEPYYQIARLFDRFFKGAIAPRTDSYKTVVASCRIAVALALDGTPMTALRSRAFLPPLNLGRVDKPDT
jgi:hypothetical protein